MKTVSAVIVTFNRKDLLKECIESLLVQTYPLEKIIVVDNASTDGTDQLVRNLVHKHPSILYVRSEKNTGGAGGFNLGLKTALAQTQSNWFWVMDDDVEALPTGLEGLMKYTDQSECLHGKRLNPNGTPYFWEASFNPSLGLAIPKADSAFKSGKDSVVVNVGCFEGMLMSRRLVDTIGLPDPRFFIAWDDTIFGYLASKHTNVLYVNHVTLKRKRALKAFQLGLRTLNETSDLYRYYHIKNRGLVKEYLKKLGEYRAFSYNVVTGLLLVKEYARAILLQRNFKAYKPLFRGLRDSSQNFAKFN